MAIAESAADPSGSAALIAQKAWQWLRPYPTAWFWPPAVVLGIGLLYVLFDFAAVLGFLRSPRPGVAAFCLAALGLSMLIHIVLQVVWRYKVPYWDPVLLLYAPFGATRKR
jgi:hypothetical protein